MNAHPDQEVALRLNDVTLTYPDGAARIVALNHANLAVGPGEFVVVTGPSGSGKSSLLAVAATLVTPDSGTISVAGADVSALSAAQRTRLRRDRIGLVFQKPHLIASLTVREQLELMGHLGGGALPNKSQVQVLLERVGLAGLEHRRPHELSGGQQQRVAIARGLVRAPSVLLVDEPTSALDHQRGAEVLELLREITLEYRTATVVVTHDLALLAPQDRVIRCVDGVVTQPDLRPTSTDL